jgi:hypothetical protein
VGEAGQNQEGKKYRLEERGRKASLDAITKLAKLHECLETLLGRKSKANLLM